MRVAFLAAIMICVSAAAFAEPSKIAEEPESLVATVALSPASEGSWADREIAAIEPIEAVGLAASELKPQAKLTKVKVQTSRPEPIKAANMQVSGLELPVSKVAQFAGTDLHEIKVDYAPLPVIRIAYVKPSKMHPAPGITGAMRYANSPWLDHAINDLGTNPTGWKRVWCARSLTMWLKMSGKRGCPTDAAISCLEAGERLPEPKVGAVAVLKHHVGIVKEIQDRHVVLVSGNNRGRPGARKVGISKYRRSTILGYVWPE